MHLLASFVHSVITVHRRVLVPLIVLLGFCVNRRARLFPVLLANSVIGFDAPIRSTVVVNVQLDRYHRSRTQAAALRAMSRTTYLKLANLLAPSVN